MKLLLFVISFLLLPSAFGGLDVQTQSSDSRKAVQEAERIRRDELRKQSNLNPLTGIALETEKSSCGSTDLRKSPTLQNNPQLKSALEEVPRQQGDQLWCGHFAVAEVLSFETKDLISAHHLVMYNNHMTRERAKDHPNFKKYLAALRQGVNLSGSDLGMMVGLARGKELCTESGFPTDWKFDERKLFSHTRGALFWMQAGNDSISCDPRVGADHLTSSTRRSLNNLFPMIADGALQEILRKTVGKDGENFDSAVFHLGQEQCKLSGKSVEIPADLKSHLVNFEGPKADPRSPYVVLDGILDNPGKPVVISFNTRDISSTSSDHAASVWAREFRDGRCMYLVRDSYGCSALNEAHREQCEPSQSGYWVSRESLDKAIYNLAHY